MRVDQINPTIILRLMNQQSSATTAIAKQHIGNYHSNPMALIDSLLNLGRVFHQNNLGELLHYIGLDTVKTLQTMLSSLIFSNSTSGNDFLKNFLHTLGFCMENQLRRACHKKFGKTRAIKGATCNLKGLLTQIIDKMHAVNGNAEHPGMEKLIGAFDTAIKAIESHQIINAALQEQEQKYLFQVPIVFPDGTGMAEIFMKYDTDSEKKTGHKKIWTLHCLLSMDALGDITVDAQIEIKRIKCAIYCRDEVVRSFIRPHVADIQEKLSALGYEVPSVGCFIKSDVGKMRKQWVSIPHSDDRDGVNVVV